MRNNLIPAVAVLLTVLFSSFTVKDCVDVFLIYNSGPQDQRSSYTETETTQSPINGNQVLAWIRVCVEGGIITDVIFACVFEELDTVDDSNNSLNDESEKTVEIEFECEFVFVIQLEKKAA